MKQKVYCYCNRQTADSHLCHAGQYTCTNEATQRFYHLGLSSLSGQQMKLSVISTWACDEHWGLFQKLRNFEEVISHEDNA